MIINTKGAVILRQRKDLGVFLDYSGSFFNQESICSLISTLNKTLEYVNNNPKYVELHNQWVKNQMRAALDSRETQLVKGDKIEKPVKLTKIYIMKDNHTGHYKIGRSDSPTKREATLLSQKSSIELIFQSEATCKFEKSLHNLFKEKRVRGEWFELDNWDIELIKGLCDE
jgi:hypothetical protein